MRNRLVLSLLAVAATITLALGLTACGAAKEVDYAGRYAMTGAIVSEIPVDQAEMSMLKPPDKNYIEIVDSRNIIFVLDGDKIETTYSKDNNVLHIKDNNKTINFTLSENEITYYIESRDTTFIFTKQ